MNPIPIPKHIDDPPLLLLWTADEFIPVVAALVIGVLMDQKLICLAVGLLSVKLYRRIRDGRPDGFVLHALYWIGVLPAQSTTVPNPFSRLFRP